MATMSDPFASIGGGVQVNGGWVPKGHPLAQQAQPQAIPAAQQPTANRDASPWGNFPSRPTNTQAPNYSYAPQSEIQAQRQTMVSRMLTNPYTMGTQQVSQLKEKNKEEVVGLEQQLASQMREQAAARGLSDRGGFVNAQEQRLGEARNRDLISSNREIDLAKMNQDRQDELQALQASEGFLKDDLARYLSGYQAQLAGAGQNLAGHQSDLGAYFSYLDSLRGDKALDLQGSLGQGGLDLDARRLGESGRQFDLSHALALMQLMEGQRQFGLGYGLDLTRLGQLGQQNTIDFF